MSTLNAIQSDEFITNREDMINRTIKISILLFVGITAIAFCIIIPHANAYVKEVYASGPLPCTYQLNEASYDANESFETTSDPAHPYYGLKYTVTGPLLFEDFNTLTSHIELPMFYDGIDNQRTVMYGFLPIQVTNTSETVKQASLGSFIPYTDIFSGTYAEALMPFYNSVDTELKPGETQEYIVTYRFMRDSFTDNAWEDLTDSSFNLVFIDDKTKCTAKIPTE